MGVEEKRNAIGNTIGKLTADLAKAASLLPTAPGSTSSWRYFPSTVTAAQVMSKVPVELAALQKRLKDLQEPPASKLKWVLVAGAVLAAVGAGWHFTR